MKNGVQNGSILFSGVLNQWVVVCLKNQAWWYPRIYVGRCNMNALQRLFMLQRMDMNACPFMSRVVVVVVVCEGLGQSTENGRTTRGSKPLSGKWVHFKVIACRQQVLRSFALTLVSRKGPFWRWLSLGWESSYQREGDGVHFLPPRLEPIGFRNWSTGAEKGLVSGPWTIFSTRNEQSRWLRRKWQFFPHRKVTQAAIIRSHPPP